MAGVLAMFTNTTRNTCLTVVILTWSALVSAAPAPTPAAVHYRVSFPAPQTHYVEVEATFPTDRKPALEVTMPVWTPGSYLVREYSRNVENVAAKGPAGQALEIDKSRKNHWRITTAGAPQVTLTYRVYSRELSVRNNWVDDLSLIHI